MGRLLRLETPIGGSSESPDEVGGMGRCTIRISPVECREKDLLFHRGYLTYTPHAWKRPECFPEGMWYVAVAPASRLRTFANGAVWSA